MAGGGGNNKSAKQKQVMARVKVEFKTKLRGKKRVKWSRRMEERNMGFEIYYNIKLGDILGPNLKDMLRPNLKDMK